MDEIVTGDKYRVLSWDELEAITRKMSVEIAQEHKSDPFHWIVAIMRGGAVVSRIVSDELGGLEIVSVGVASYDAPEKQGVLRFYEPLAVEVSDQKVLLIDEICDTGETFVQVLEHIKTHNPREIKTATVMYKEHSKFRPDYIGETDGRWVVFPYDKREMEK